MVDLIKPRINVTTKEGECQVYITIDLNVNINGITTSIENVGRVETKEESPEWVIPTFNSGEKISFGKKG